MKFKTLLLLVLSLGLVASGFSQTLLDPNQFVNTQITGPGVYKVEAGKAYAFDGRIDLTFEIAIEGPNNGWIKDDPTPAVLVNTPAEDGTSRQFFEIKEGGSLTIKNLMFSGVHSNGELVGTFIANTAGHGYTAENVAFADWKDFAFRNQGEGLNIKITDCVFINGVRTTYSPWGGFPMRMDVAGEYVLVENNTVVNSGRLLANSGPFFNATVHEIHNTYLNSTKAGHEQRAYQMIQANNIFYNYDFIGHNPSGNTYDSYFTTWNYFHDAANDLDKISLFLGSNLFYRDQAILDWFAADTFEAGLLWEHAAVDSFVTIDDNYTIGTNYADYDPGFTMPPGNTAAIVQFIDEYWHPETQGEWPDWRIASPVTWNADGLPEITAWPPAVDLSYSNAALMEAGTDGLPLGDLNWFPAKKALYKANRGQFVSALQDSVRNAKAVYVPGSATPMWTPSNPKQAPAVNEVTLDPNQFVNTQITGPGVYKVEAGKAYAFDGRIDLTFEIAIEGPNNGWIKDDATPAVLVNTPAEDGTSRQFFEIKEGGSLTIKNLMFSGVHSNGELVGTFIANTAGHGYTAENVAFADWKDFAFRNQGEGLSIQIKNCVFVNGVRTTYSPWGGFPMRMDVAGEYVLVENNTVVNSGRLLANSGPFFNATVHEIHNTYLNSTKAGHEQRAYQMIQANNIFYNYDFIGHNPSGNTYDSYFTTWNYFHDAANDLDKISLFLGSNLFYRDQAILDWFAADTFEAGLLWEHAAVDSFVTIDDNYTIGTNYADYDPGFTTPPGNTAAIVQFIDEYWHPETQGEWPDWRIASPVTWNADGLPEITAWPPAVDLSYSNAALMEAGTDGLPLGDLNWFPAKKAIYETNRDQYVLALQDSVRNAKAVYVPGSATPMWTPSNPRVLSVSGEIIIPTETTLYHNYPNPFNPETTIEFNLAKSGRTTLEVYNVMGQRVATLVNGQLNSGLHRFTFDATQFATGVYIYKLTSGNVTQVKKMMFLK